MPRSKTSSNNGENTGGSEFFTGPTYEYYRIENPEVGTWSGWVYGDDLPADPETYRVYMAVESDLTLDVTFDKARYATGEGIHIEALLYNGGERQSDLHLTGGEPITDAYVEMIVTDPDDNEIIIPFVNSGEGLYTSTFSATSDPGSYNFIIKALKVYEVPPEEGEYGTFEFYRESLHSVFVSSANEYSPESDLLFNIQLAILQLPDDTFLPPADQRKDAFMNKLDAVGKMIDKGNFNVAATKLEDDILIKMDGDFGGDPSDDWIIDEEAQQEVYPMVVELIDLLRNQLPKKDESNTAETSIPEYFDLYQNYPNPFNPNTVIKYQLPEPTRVILEIYDVLGRKVATLVDINQEAGYYEVPWNAANFSSGIYIYRIQAGKFVATKKLLLLK